MLVNQYSFVIVGLSLLSIVTWSIWRYYGLRNSIIAACIIILLLCCVQVLLSTKNKEVTTIDGFEKELSQHRPILLMMYSDY